MLTLNPPRHWRPPARPAAPASSSHIPELHGLRGLALAFVVVFHLFGNGRVSGGVDVFLFVSGFLVTGSLVRRAENRELRLREQYARHATRLLPAALVVLAGVALLTVLALPRGSWIQTSKEILASAVFAENWELISSQLSYEAAGPATSPVQHFWSLAVQGQFFLAWPLVVLALAALARTFRLRLAPVVAVVALVATVASFAFATYLVDVDQPVAYFHSATRFWELGAGTLLALARPYLRLPGPLPAVLGWAGLALVVSSGFVVDGATTFPGPWALWPVIGAMLVLVGSEPQGRTGPRMLLDTPPLRVVADMSYALYLWHWPLLIAYLAWKDQPSVGPRGALVVLAASTALAWLTQMLVERRAVRRGATLGAPRVLAVTVASVTVVALAATGAGALLDAADVRERAKLTAASPQYPGARALDPGYVPTAEDVPVMPAPHIAATNVPWIFAKGGCVQFNGGTSPTAATELLTCTLNDPPEPSATIVMVGDSHMAQWEPAMTPVAKEQNWRVLLFGKRGCRFATEFDDVKANQSCQTWNASVLKELVSLRPDAVVVLGTRTYTTRDGEKVAHGEVAGWQELQSHGIRVVTIRDNPRFARDVPTCVERHPDLSPCGRDRAELYPGPNPVISFPGVPSDAGHVDLTDHLCGPERCEAVVGNVLVYRDDDHITAAFAKTLAPALADELRSAAGWLFDPTAAPPAG